MSKKNKKNIKNRFNETMQIVSEIIGKECCYITRNEYIRAAVDNNVEGRLNKEELNLLGGFAVLRKVSYPIPEKTKEEIAEEKRLELEELYLDYVREIGITPSLKIVKSWGFTLGFVKDNYNHMRGLYDFMAENHPEIFAHLVNDSIFTDTYFKQLQKDIKKKSRFIVTTAVSGKQVDINALNSLKTYCNLEDAMIIVQPCEDVASRNSIFEYELDRRLRDCGFAFNDLYLNSNIYLSSIKVSAKQINPLTGLDRLAQAQGTTVLASPKQYLKFVPTSNTKLPSALMTTGAITERDYSTDKSMSKRTSYLAEFDHIKGAIIVEIEDDEIFHFRQIEFDSDGSFYDFGWKYNPDGTVEEVEETVCVFGDTHVGSHNEDVNLSLKEITEYVRCKEIIVHDIFDNRFNNHHDAGKPVKRAILARKGKTKLMEEGRITSDWINDWSNSIDKVTIVKSNHDEALERYIDEGRWKDDPENLYDAALLVRKRMDGEDPLKYLIEKMVGLQNPEKINWLERDEDYKVYGIENGSHGDKGANGSRGSLMGIERSYNKATVGHSHTAGILRRVYQVGTSTHLKLGYNTGPSSWTNTMCIQYPNGQRQLINMFKNKKGVMVYKKLD